MSSMRNQGTLVLVAVLAGVSTAAGVVMVQALRLPAVVAAESLPGSIPAGRYTKPSVFGTGPIAPPSDAKASPAQIAQAANMSIVTVTGYDEQEKPVSQGVGFIYVSSGMVITTFSAIRGASTVTIDTPKGEELNVIALMGYSVSENLAALGVLEGNLTAMETGPGDPVQEGDGVYTFGPQGALLQAKVGPRRATGGVDLFAISTLASPGMPVINERGRIIGIVHHEAMVMPSHYISDLLEQKRVISFADMLRETHLTPQVSGR